MSFRDKVAALFQCSAINLPVALVDDIIQRNGAQPWFLYAFKERSSRWDIWRSCLWLAKRLRSDARILETGCGCALNLIWFGQQGFRCLYGADIDPAALAAGKELCEAAGVSATLWLDDALKPSQIPAEPFDAILALNWTHLTEDFDLRAFLEIYSHIVTVGGYVVIDVIDALYNRVPKNRYLSSDWDKPEDQRQPSEYKKRFSAEQVNETVRELGLRVVKTISRPDVIPRRVYMICR